MPRPKLKVLRKPENKGYGYNSPRETRRTIMPSSCLLENFSGFQLKESITLLNMSKKKSVERNPRLQR